LQNNFAQFGLCQNFGSTRLCVSVQFGSAIIIHSYITSTLTDLAASNMKMDLVTTYGIHITIITLLNRFGSILASKMADHAI
jgi:hypothetical protein